MAYSRAGKGGVESLTGILAAFKTGWKGRGVVLKSQIQPNSRWRLRERVNTERASRERKEGKEDEGEEEDGGRSNSGGHSSSKHRRVTPESSLP